ncbi:MAG TPA: hypothetical protein PLZ93_21710 [Nocardioides sp.]|uniref:hypothetical protein n=1 Tax=uncultured Nocardioides sp. TaxID=198441 RepID=UPI00260E11DE|nr:hypothetical protein [uncultured Nocardioides sp.]HRI98255.1 hypothetical protein [Nocardioides sp.]
MTSTTLTSSSTGIGGKQKAGLVICLLFGLANLPSVLTAPADGETGPPMAILVVDTLLGAIAIVAAILAWRGNRVALRVAAGAIILITITGLPAFFVDVPMGVKALVGLSVLLTVLAVVLMFSAPRSSSSIDD